MKNENLINYLFYILIFFPKLSKTSKKLKIMDTLVMIFDTETSGFSNSGGRLI